MGKLILPTIAIAEFAIICFLLSNRREILYPAISRETRLRYKRYNKIFLDFINSSNLKMAESSVIAFMVYISDKYSYSTIKSFICAIKWHNIRFKNMDTTEIFKKYNAVKSGFKGE